MARLFSKERDSFGLSNYDGHDLHPEVPVHLPHNLTQAEFRSLLCDPAGFGFSALQKWLAGLLENFELQTCEEHPFHKHPFRLRELDVQAVDWFWRNRPGNEDKLGFMKIQAKVETDPYVHQGEKEARADWLPGAVFLRGQSVAMLIIVQPEGAKNEDSKYVILTIQPRIAAGSLAFMEIPAGMLEEDSFSGAAAREIEEEAGLVVKEKDLINMTALTVDSQCEFETLAQAIYPSVGACDESIPIFLYQKQLSAKQIEELKGKATGLRNEGELITLKLVPLKDAWKEGCRDAKTLMALALYENLKREGKIPDICGT